MNKHYNKEEAGHRLTELSKERVVDNDSGKNFIAAVPEKRWPAGIHVEMIGTPPSLRLTRQTDDGDKEELVFTVQGILLKKDLPPVDKPLGKNTRIAFLNQQVILTGLGCEIFGRALKGLDGVDNQFRRNLDEEDVEHHKVGTTVDGHEAIELSNRYVTCKGATNGVGEVGMDDIVDPKGYLLALMSDKYIRTEENVVEYYELLDAEADGAQTYSRAPPKRFKKGDIVEAQFSLSCVSLGQRSGNKWRMVGVLRSLTLLDGKYTEEATQAERDNFKRGIGEKLGYTGREESKVATSAAVLKRKVGHGTTMVSETKATDGTGDIFIPDAKKKME
ncbi:hypothetical protein PM082_007036 [Marasmius tenuissimus]|nr:hypothetical protein PM082_007036 [Marasmius tenuissimus]